MPLPPTQIYSNQLLMPIRPFLFLSLLITPPLFLIVRHDDAAFYFIIYHVVFRKFSFLKNINTRLKVKALQWSSTSQDQCTVPPTSHMCICTYLFIQLSRPG